MKAIIALFCAVLLCASCTNEFTHEDEVCDCYSEKLVKSGFNLNDILDDLEVLFIQENMLEGRSGENYVKAVSKLEDYVSKGTPELSPAVYPLLNELSKAVSDEDCLFARAKEMPDSKLSEINTNFFVEFENSRNIGTDYFNVVVSLVGSAGFEHPFYQAEYFNFFYYLIAPID